jgi:hypothetical protein
MITSERIKPAAKCIKRLYALSAIRYQQKFRSNIDSFMRDVAGPILADILAAHQAQGFRGFGGP